MLRSNLVVNMIGTTHIFSVICLLAMEAMSKSAHRTASLTVCSPHPCKKHEDCDWRRCAQSNKPQAPRCQTVDTVNGDVTCCGCSNQNDRYLPAEKYGDNPSFVEENYDYLL